MSIRYGLLALLQREPMYGYQLRTEFESSTGGTWPLNVGQVYTTLARLERDGSVAVRAGDGAQDADAPKTYAITARGQEELAGWFATPVSRSQPPRDELAIKLAMAIAAPGVDVRSVIQAQRTDTLRALQDYTRLKLRAQDSDLPWLLVLDSLIFGAEAEVRWLAHCEARLVRHRPLPSTEPAAVPARSESWARR
ncbi:helix-turn-helix transcriptional regulator [soil metagenome]